MAMVLGTLNYLGGLGTFAQVLLGLPMALDLLGPPAFLLLSFLFTLHHFLYSTLRLLLKNTPFAPLISLLSFASPSITTGCIALTLYFHLNPPAPGPSSVLPGVGGVRYAMVEVLPYWYANILRFVSPLFTLGEGIATLLVIQLVGRVGKGWADEDQADEGGFEWRSLLGLVAAAVYVVVLGATLTSTLLGQFDLDPGFSGLRSWRLESRILGHPALTTIAPAGSNPQADVAQTRSTPARIST